MIITRAIITIPPINCVKLLQKRIEKGRLSTSAKMEDAVVEKPDVDSKKASMNDGIVPLIRYGKVPISEMITHDKVTVRKPSLVLNLSRSVFRDIRWNATTRKAVMAADHMKGKGYSL